MTVLARSGTRSSRITRQQHPDKANEMSMRGRVGALWDGCEVARRIVIIVTGVAVAALCVMFACLGLDDANTAAAVISALAGVAAVGVTVWAALNSPSKDESMVRARGTRTGLATARAGGTANTGVSASTVPGLDVVAKETGDAVATGDGDANTGVRLT